MNGLPQILEALRPELAPFLLISARLLPVTFLCPLLGGLSVPVTVRLALTLALTGFLRGAGVGDGLAPLLGLALPAAAIRELLLGVGIGLVASLPFDAARMGGRFVDLFRGSSAEAALPLAGTREAASGDFLHQLLVAMSVAQGALPMMVAAFASTFSLLGPGAPLPHEHLVVAMPSLVLSAMAAGLAIGAPIAGLVLLVDAALGFCARVAPQLHIGEIGTPLKILAGGGLFFLGLGVVAQRLLGELEHVPAILNGVLS